jgi:hypothetical protein
MGYFGTQTSALRSAWVSNPLAMHWLAYRGSLLLLTHRRAPARHPFQRQNIQRRLIALLEQIFFLFQAPIEFEPSQRSGVNDYCSRPILMVDEYARDDYQERAHPHLCIIRQ